MLLLYTRYIAIFPCSIQQNLSHFHFRFQLKQAERLNKLRQVKKSAKICVASQVT
jgi:hypothetical protein